MGHCPRGPANPEEESGLSRSRPLFKGAPASLHESSFEESIARRQDDRTRRGVTWLIQAVGDGSYREPSPIGFYFAKLWYFEKLYPLIFTVAALGRARRQIPSASSAV